jgi:2-dehydro-3-deoxyphosphogluconate aldolase/(4S)-4-hydroxy-2-oxoglutarate aldolase
LVDAPVVPLVATDDPLVAVQTAKALQAGGLSVIEVVMRSDRALAGLEAVIAETEGLVVGAGTVLTRQQAIEVCRAGSAFVVCPGLVDDLVNYCLDEDVPVYPGTMTAGEVQRAFALGLRDVKFFPASLAGGIPMLKAFGSVFREMRFMPTGGIGPDNLCDYLALPHVLACGGSWLTPPEAIAKGDFGAVEQLAREAVDIAAQARNRELSHV